MPSFQLTVHAIYQALAQANLAKVLALLDEGVVVQQAASLPYGGTFHGRQGFIAHRSLLVATWEIYLKVPALFLTGENDIVVVGDLQGRGRRAGRSLTIPFTDHWQQQEGRITQIRMFDWDTAQLLDDLQPADTESK